ncbi:hypothetical protein [Pelosinus sp. IPA-1]|uniref:hypothetical protein n=1 Tax=Pelosinus sp. IPA-1 TaxID=3029569 RepID=UPI00243629A1|nr:hypothetical protein [Pelosinus sp. IPA-1]GMB02057.1 hypothetical protein PIPA1_48570 [Pelosinus sp. IPA-1]
MAKVLYDFLNDSPLFNDKKIEEKFSGVSNKDLEKEINAYREYSLKKASNLLSEIKNSKQKISATMEGFNSFIPDEQTLKQFALYMDSVVINDPLFKMTHRDSQFSKTMNQYLGYDGKDEIDKIKLVKAVSYMKKLTPMIAGNFVKFFPMSYIHEPPQQLPIHMSDNHFSDILPEELLQWFRKRSTVVSLKKSDDGWRILKKLYISRSICVQFEGDNSKNANIYQLFESDFKDIDKKTGKFQMTSQLPDELPEANYFNGWVYQSVNKSAKAKYDQIILELYYSNMMGNSYFTRSPFVADLLNFSFGKTKSLEMDIANLGLSLDLPTIQNVSMEKLMYIRENEGEAFNNFRIELEKQLREVRLINNEEQLKLKLENIAHEFEEVQINEIRKKMKHFKRSIFSEVFLGLGTLYTSVHFNIPWLLTSLFGIGWAGSRSFNDKINTVNDNPAYFLWKLKN